MSRGGDTVMKFSTMKYFFKDALKSLKRHTTITIASVATVAASLFVFGVFLITILNVNQGLKNLGSKLQVMVYLNSDATIQQQAAVDDALNSYSEVQKVEFISKEEALKMVKQQFGTKYKDILEGYSEQNMPVAYKVTVKKPELISTVVNKIKKYDGIYEIKDSHELVNQVVTITNTIKIVGIVISLILGGVSLFLINNTIKLTVYARRREISIMKYIGATDWFIRWPFVMEGVIIGIMGTALACILLFYLYRFAVGAISSQYITVQLISPGNIMATIIGWFILGGIAIGALGSSLSMKKFLSV